MSRPILFETSGDPFATGVARFRDGTGVGSVQTGPRIYLEVVAEALPRPILAMVDTAAPWCIFEPEVGRELKADLDVVEERALLHTRLGRYLGVLGHARLKLRAEEGEDLDFTALIFLSPDWPGGNFIGYQGCLDRIRFAVDPHRNRFYFSSL